MQDKVGNMHYTPTLMGIDKYPPNPAHKMHSNFIIRSLQFLLLVLSFPIPGTQAQTITDTLKEIKVTAKPTISTDSKLNTFAPGMLVTSMDSTTLQQYKFQNMANMLAQQTPVFVKSYGFNSLSTLSFRGASAAQSAVLWNGIPLQNAATGIADVSTLPVLFMDKVNLVYGGSSALWGSGNVGGALMLETAPPRFGGNSNSLSVMVGAGSFGQLMYGAKAAFSLNSWYLAANIYLQTAQNNFTYTNENGGIENMANSKLSSTSVSLQAAHKINGYNTVNFMAWYQNMYREIPPALFEPSSSKCQTDKSLHLLGDLQRKTENALTYAKVAFTTDGISYTDNAVMVNSNSTTYQLYGELGYKKQLGKLGQFMVFLPLQEAKISTLAQNTNTTITYDQPKAALAGAYDLKLMHQKLDVSINAREEVLHGGANLLPGADAGYQICRWLSLRANAQRTYRVPTLNELYYFPGGNSSLKPEQGWATDGGYTLCLQHNNISLTHSGTVFYRDIKDWVLWLGGAVWTPHNIAEVASRGTETETNLVYKPGQWEIHLGVNTAYCLSTTQSSYIPNDGSIGKQIPYAPRYNGQANLGVNYKRFGINYNHTYTGYRFITSDESEYLMPYQTGNLQALYSTRIFKRNLQLNAQCNNIWNQQYQVVAYRPMPGTNWLVGCRFDLLD